MYDAFEYVVSSLIYRSLEYSIAIINKKWIKI